MERQYLLALKKRIAQMTTAEQVERDIYLGKLASGELQGPPVGYVSIDKPYMKYHTEEAIRTEFTPMSAYELMVQRNAGHENDLMFAYYFKKYTFGDALRQIDITAKALLELGVTKESVVMMALPNCPEAVFLFYAVNKIGATINALDPRYSKDNLMEAIEEAKSKFFFATSVMVNNLASAPADVRIISVSPFNTFPFGLKQLMEYKATKGQKLERAMTWNAFIKLGKLSKLDTVASVFEPDKGCIIVHTGGTTGTPKGVVLSNENFNGLIYQLLNNDVGLERGLTFLNILPPFVAMGLDDGLHLAACAGIYQYLIPTLKPEDFPGLVMKYKPNLILCGPVHCEMMKKKLTAGEDLSFIKLIMFGGGEYENEKQAEFNAFLREHGCSIDLYCGYGATETASGNSCQKPSCYKLGCSGAPYLKCVDGLFDPETQEEIYGLDQVGELYISGPTVMQGYYGNKEEETSKVIFTDEAGVRWYRSGDLAHFDADGMLVYDGRMKRIITRSAFKIYPQYIEQLIAQHPMVDQCAVVGITDDEELSIPVANIVIKAGCSNPEETKESIIAFCDEIISEKVSPFARMAGFNFLKDLPQTGIGKLDFRTLELLGIRDVRR